MCKSDNNILCYANINTTDFSKIYHVKGELEKEHKIFIYYKANEF